MNTRDINNLTDEQLLSLMKKDNQLAFNQIYNRYWEELLKYSLNILKKKTLAEDAVQEVFTKIWLQRKKSSIIKVRAYLYSAVRNRSLLKLRYNSKFTDYDLNLLRSYHIKPKAEQHLDYLDLKCKVEKAAKKLPKRCKEIFFMSRLHNYSINEIALHFNISKRTVENQLHHALKHVRGTLSKVLNVLIWISIFTN